MTKIESPWGEEFDIILPDEKTSVKRAKKQLEGSKDSTSKTPKKSKSIPLKDTLAMIKEEVLRVLGRYADNIAVIRDYDEFHGYISKAIEIGSIAVDTETNNTTNTTNCLLMGLCLYTKGEKQVYIPVNHINSETFEKLENQITEEQIGFELKRLIDNKTKVIMHNSTFDYEVLKYTCEVELPAHWDSMVAARLLNENEKAGLKEQYISKIDHTQEKYNITKLFKGLRYALVDPEIFAYYAATDSYETFRLYDEYQLEAFKDPDLSKVLNLFLTEEMPLTKVVGDMEMRGVKIDKEFNERLSKKYHLLLEKCDVKISKELESLESTIKEWSHTKDAWEKPKQFAKEEDYKKPDVTKKFPEIENGKRFKYGKSKAEKLDNPIKLTSSTQLSILFYDILKCPQVSKKHPRGTGKDELPLIYKALGLPICKMILERRGLVKLLSTYIDNIPKLLALWPDGRIRTHFKQLGADTGRFSSGGKVKLMNDEGKEIEISGVNLQNIPSKCKEIRMTYTADDVEEDVKEENNTFKVKSYTSVETPNGFKLAKELSIGDSLVIQDEENQEILPIKSINIVEQEVEICV